MTKQLNKEQLHTLEKYERYFAQAVGARYCSYPGQAGVTEMLGIWNEVTGEGRKIRQGCSTCIFHLVVDLGTLYLAQKAEMQKEAEKAAEAKRLKEEAEAKKKAEELAAKKKAEEEAKAAAAEAAAKAAAEAEKQGGTSENPNTQSAEKPADEKAAQEGPAPSDGTTTQQKPKGRSRAKGEGKEGQK